MFSIVQWNLQSYWHYALIVAVITLLAATISLLISRANFRCEGARLCRARQLAS